MQCTKCSKPKDGESTSGMCRACEAAYRRAWRAANPAKVAKACAWQAEYAKARPEIVAASQANLNAKRRAETAKRRAEAAADRRRRNLYTVGEAARSLGIGNRTIGAQIDLGVIAVAERFGARNRALIHGDEIERYRAAHLGKYGPVNPAHPLHQTYLRNRARQAAD